MWADYATGGYPGTPGCVIGEVGVGHDCTQFSVSKGCVLTTYSLELLELRINALNCLCLGEGEGRLWRYQLRVFTCIICIQ